MSLADLSAWEKFLSSSLNAIRGAIFFRKAGHFLAVEPDFTLNSPDTIVDTARTRIKVVPPPSVKRAWGFVDRATADGTAKQGGATYEELVETEVP